MHDKKITSKKREMLKQNFLLIGLILIILFIFGCTSESDIKDTQSTTITQSEEPTTLVTESNSLEGTCPKGKTSNCFGECSLFIDKDKDGYCDRS